MATKWTKDQLKVIETVEGNLLVSAAAGSGKTAVLVERIIRMITDEKNPIDIDKFVIMTFTRAAAAQMRQKIGDALETLIEEHPENKNLMKQYKMLNNATICTIDSFCVSLVRDYFHKIDVDPTFRIADETELGLISADTLNELFEKRYSEQDRAFLDLAEIFGDSRSDRKLSQMVVKLADKALAQPWPKEWLISLVNSYEIGDEAEFNSTKVAVEICNYVKELFKSFEKRLEFIANICNLPNGPEYYLDSINMYSNLTESVLKAESYSEISSRLQNIDFGRLPSKRGLSEEEAELKTKAQGMINDIKESIKNITSKFFFAECAPIIDMIKNTAPTVRALSELTTEYLDLFREKKKEKNVIDFSDAEHYALEILLEEKAGVRVRSEAALELQAQYAEIIIDEYQDSNLIQESIARAIAGEDNSKRPYVFTVGDVKQSIYKFRNACPELFLEKQDRFSGDSSEGKLIILDKNFRSREEVLAATNSAFMFMMIREIGGIDYDERCSLKCGISEKPVIEEPYKAELILIKKGLTPEASEAVENAEQADTKLVPDGEKTQGTDKGKSMQAADESSEEGEDSKKQEALTVANRIKELVYREKILVRDKKNGEDIKRPVQFGDITILLRSMKDWANVYSLVLEAEGIPCITDSRDGFFKTNEVSLVTYYLSLLDNPRQDIPLTAVLHSYLCGLTAEDLAKISIAAGPVLSFYDACRLYHGREDITGGVDSETVVVADEIYEKLYSFFKIFYELYDVKNDISVPDLINMLYEKTHIYSYVASMRDGVRRKANLELLLRYAANYEKTSYSGLFSFIRYLDELKTHELDYGEAGNEQAANSVRIMSIHKSKGLEFPVVILGAMGKGFNRMDINDSVVVSSEHGLAMKYHDLEKRVKYPSLFEAFIRMKMSEELIGEELRLLYVAMTRAKEKLIMVGQDSVLSRGSYKDIDWTEYGSEKVSYADLIDINNYMQMVYPAARQRDDLFDIYPAINGKLFKSNDTGEELSFGTETDNCEKQEEQTVEEKEYEGYRKLILKCRNSIYPYGNDEAIPIKLSVSDLKLKSLEEEHGENPFEETRGFVPGGKKTVPDFMKEEAEKAGGTNYGTLVHKCMQFMKLDISSKMEMEAFLKQLVAEGRISQAEYESLNINKLLGFVKSETANRMKKSEEKGGLFREQQFMIGKRACDISEEYAGNELLIPIQGVIDVMFIEDGEIVILDYKTDRITTDDGEAELREKYRLQLELYAEAATRLLNLPVKEMLIFSFALGKAFTV